MESLFLTQFLPLSKPRLYLWIYAVLVTVWMWVFSSFSGEFKRCVGKAGLRGTLQDNFALALQTHSYVGNNKEGYNWDIMYISDILWWIIWWNKFIWKRSDWLQMYHNIFLQNHSCGLGELVDFSLGSTAYSCSLPFSVPGSALNSYVQKAKWSSLVLEVRRHTEMHIRGPQAHTQSYDLHMSTHG